MTENNIVEIKPVPVEPKEPEINEACVAALGLALEEAKMGEITGVFMSKQFVTNNAVAYHIAGSYNAGALIGSISVGLHILLAEEAAGDVVTCAPEDAS